MLINNLKIAVRQLARQKLNTVLHLLGLSLGLGTCLLIYLFIRHERSYDHYHQRAARVYRVTYESIEANREEKSGITPYPTGAALRTDFPELEKVVSCQQQSEMQVEVTPEQRFTEEQLLFAEPELFDMLDYRVLHGDARAALGQPTQLVLTETLARKYFGSTEAALGRMLKLAGNKPFEVGAVIADPPGNTNFPACMLLPYMRYDTSWNLGLDPRHWGFTSAGVTLVLLPEGMAPEQLEARLPAFADKHLPAEVRRERRFGLQPLQAVHTQPDWDGSEFVPAVRPRTLWLFGSIGFAVLLLACINFINLSTAQALARMREVGVRKAVGALRGQLIAQFWSEAWLLSVAAALTAVALAKAVLPSINTLLDKRIEFDPIGSPALLGVIVGGVALTSFLAGFYPAFLIARTRPVEALKSRSQTGGDRRSAGLRKALVVFQFAVSAGLLAAVLVVFEQMQYIREKDLGFTRDNILTVSLPEVMRGNATLSRDWLALPGIERVSFSLGPPTSDSNVETGMSPTGLNQGQDYEISIKPADHEYVSTYDLKLIAGRSFEPADTLLIARSIPRDDRKYRMVVNEHTAKILGYARPDDIVGKRLQIGINDMWVDVIGVVEDFHTASLHREVGAVGLLNFPYFYASASLRLRPGANLPATLAAVEKSWQQVFPEHIFDYGFVDKSLEELYRAEERTFSLFQFFAAVAVLISCLGLWGLATYAALQRRKEIGIRKTLGASSTRITALLVGDFLKLVVLALVLAGPVAYMLMNRWLDDFAYRITLGCTVFVVPGVVALLIALLTVSVQSVRAALANPVESLNRE
jgi:putative ABC transport system permease protein